MPTAPILQIGPSPPLGLVFAAAHHTHTHTHAHIHTFLRTQLQCRQECGMREREGKSEGGVAAVRAVKDNATADIDDAIMLRMCMWMVSRCARTHRHIHIYTWAHTQRLCAGRWETVCGRREGSRGHNESLRRECSKAADDLEASWRREEGREARRRGNGERRRRGTYGAKREKERERKKERRRTDGKGEERSAVLGR